jgi:hypothetical protein
MAAPRQHDQFPDAKPTSTLSKPRASRIAGALSDSYRLAIHPHDRPRPAALAILVDGLACRQSLKAPRRIYRDGSLDDNSIPDQREYPVLCMLHENALATRLKL